MILQQIYENREQQLYLSDCFVYRSETYMIWKWGFSLLDDSYLKSEKYLKLKDQKVKKKDYQLYRSFELIGAPLDYLVNNGFKILSK